MSTQRKARPIPVALDSEETLAIERPWLPRAGIFAILAGVLPLIAFAMQIITNNGIPKDASRVKTVAESLTTYAAGQQGQGQHGYQALVASYYGDHAVIITLATIIAGIGFIAAAPVLHGLLRSSWRRRPSFPRWFLWAPVVGGIAFGVGTSIAMAYGSVKLSDFNSLASALQTNIAANDALNAARNDLGPLSIISILGNMLFAVGVGAAALSAMNVGLLTRLMGMIGVIVAVLVVFPILDQQGLLRSFWFIAVGLVLLGRWPGGRTPAWVTGDAQPWPSRAMQMEAAERARAQKAASAERPAPKPKASDSNRKRRK